MKSADIYISFDGTCREAFEYYRSVFGGTFQSLSTFSEMPETAGMPAVPEAMKDRIMHISLPIGRSVLMGSDHGEGWGPPYQAGNNFSISLQATSRAEADRVIEALSAGGQITMPMGETFWESYFGMCIDRFGISWMISYAAE